MAHEGRLNFFRIGHPSQSSDRGFSLILMILALGLALRLFAAYHTAIINPDGTIYIHQARALYYGIWGSVNTCSTAHFPTVTTLAIAAFYPLFNDWIVAGMAVSMLFGILTLVPLYLLARRFFAKDVSALLTLIYALTPILIDGSVDVIRDSTAWFFATLGFYLFTGLKRQTAFYLMGSSLCFIIAAWTRVEFTIFVILSPIYLLMDREEKPFRRAALFLLPVALILAAAIGGQMLLHPSRVNWFRLKEIPEKSSAFFSHYQTTRVQLKELINHPLTGIPADFLDNTRNLLWFLGFGVILQNTMEAAYYPFFIVYLLGLGNLRERIAADRRVLYFALLAPAALLLLYFYLFTYWMMENRWIPLALFPAFIFLGHGLEKLISLIQTKFTMKRGMALLLICSLSLVFALPKNMKPRETDKIVFKRMGEMIAAIEGNSKKIEILTTGTSVRWISFYANLRFKGAPCPDEHLSFEGLIGNSYSQFVSTIKAKGFKYLVWEEKRWPGGRFNLFSSPSYRRDFIELGAWNHRDTGKILLLKVR
jgi:4-amino-4-deoxy-L-arabinose transferase-like glycosyltransferase